jgi:hypothetical protein
MRCCGFFPQHASPPCASVVTRAQMTAALLDAVANPPDAGTRIVEVPDIRRAGP